MSMRSCRSVLVFALLIALVDASDFYQCQPLVHSAGVLIPRGDVFVARGSESILFHCHLDPDHHYFREKGVRARDLVVDVAYIDDDDNERSTLETSIVNDTTVSATFNPVKATEAVVTCKVHLDANEGNAGSDESLIRGVCQTRVYIGEPPLAPVDFKCVSENWQSLNCTWKEPQNFIKTSYELFYQSPGRHRAEVPCPSHLGDGGRMPRGMCFQDMSSDPPYRQSIKHFPFLMHVTNALNTDGVIYPFSVNHFAIVRPNAAEELVLSSPSPYSIRISFRIPRGLEHFSPGLIMSLSYKSDLDRGQKELEESILAKNIVKHNFTIHGLQPFALYTVHVRLRSAMADQNDDDMWSKASTSKVRTMATLPARPPRTTLGSFEVEMNGLQSRKIFVYWQRLARSEYHGPQFGYDVTQIVDSHHKGATRPELVTTSYAMFLTLPLQALDFDIVSFNEMGRSTNASRVSIGGMSEMRQLQPRSLTRIAYGSNLFELSWLKPLRSEDVERYTVFWCLADDNRDRPYQCDGDLEWLSVDSSQLSVNVTVKSGSKSVYQFAVSASTSSNLSSGMVWATCTILHSKVVNKMSVVSIDIVKKRAVRVQWRLECADRVGIVVGFKIVYCSIDDADNKDSKCKDDEENFVKVGAEANQVWIDDLTPFTTYKVSVSVLSRAGEGELSDPLVAKTLIDRPDSPPVDLQAELYTPNGLVVSWKPPLLPNGPIDHYQVEVSHTNFKGKLEQSRYLTSAESYELPELKYYKSYQIKVTGCNQHDDINEPLCSLHWAEERVRTKIGPSTQMPEPSVVFVNGSNIRVELDTDFDAGGPIELFELRMVHSDAQDVFPMDARHSSHLIELDANNKPDCVNDSITNVYSFSVRAVTVHSETKQRYFSPWSTNQVVHGYCSDDVPWLALCAVVVTVPLAVVVTTLYLCRCLTSYKQTNILFKEVQKELIVLNDHNTTNNDSNKTESNKPWDDSRKEDDDDDKQSRKHNYDRALSKDSMETLLSVGKRRREGSETTSGCESARSSEVEESYEKQPQQKDNKSTSNATKTSVNASENDYVRGTTSGSMMSAAVDNASSYIVARPLSNVGEEEQSEDEPSNTQQVERQLGRGDGYVAFESLCRRGPASPLHTVGDECGTSKGYISLAQVNRTSSRPEGYVAAAMEPSMTSTYVSARSTAGYRSSPTTGYVSAQPMMSPSLSPDTLPPTPTSLAHSALARSSLV